MEILMKLKCSPSAPGSAQHSTLKVVDHHHQLQQHTLVSAPQHTVPSHLPLHPNPGQARMPPPPPQEVLMPTACLEYATATMDCCTAAAAAAQRREMADINRYASHSHHGAAATEYGSMPYGGGPAYCGGGAFETPSCCSGIIPSYSMIATSPSVPVASQIQTYPDLYANTDGGGGAEEFQMLRYEYHEPEENFVSIDDAKIKGFLMRIGQEADARRAQVDADANAKGASSMELEQEQEPVVFEIIELDDEEEREKLMRLKNQAESKNNTPHTPSKYVRPNTKSPSISLIPKTSETLGLPSKMSPKTQSPVPSMQKIIAQIELLDSSSSSSSDEEEDVAGCSEGDEDGRHDNGDNEMRVCELDCVVIDGEEDETEETTATNSAVATAASCTSSPGQQQPAIVILHSDDDDNCDFIDEQEEGVELRWDDLEEQKERNFFECFLCGKKVQSSYNLRRHMMIHTGERPFGCDMCDRRFREFSDLKKHRRRHTHQPNFVCMVCRVNKPTENDPTRCGSCDTKNGALIAASRPQLATTPQHEQSETPPPLPPAKNTPTRNRTPAPPPPLVGPPTPPAAALPTAPKSVPISPPPLTPISSSALAADTQLLLDTIPAVHRPANNQLGVVTRREFPCPLCQRPFGTRHNLKRHFMIHTGEKPFSCSKCRKPFREYSTLKKHMVTHIRDRWYKCLRCPQKYRDYLDYMAHRNTHPKEETPPSAASSAGSATPSPKKRTKMRPADDYDSNDEDSASEDWLECCECGQRFTDIEAYTEHLKEHDPSLHLFECYICKESFEHRDELEQHVKEEHDCKRKRSASESE